MRLRITLYPIYQTDLMNVAEKREFCAVFGCGVRRSTRKLRLSFFNSISII